MAYKALLGSLRDSIQAVAGGVSPGSQRLGSAVILVVRKVDFGVLRVVLRAGVECLSVFRVGLLVRGNRGLEVVDQASQAVRGLETGVLA